MVPAFADTTVHLTESFSVVAPDVPEETPAPAAAAPAGLAFTGSDGSLQAGAAALGVALAGAVMLVTSLALHVRRRRRGHGDTAEELLVSSAP